jgi:hypothetical protein
MWRNECLRIGCITLCMALKRHLKAMMKVAEEVMDAMGEFVSAE